MREISYRFFFMRRTELLIGCNPPTKAVQPCREALCARPNCIFIFFSFAWDLLIKRCPWWNAGVSHLNHTIPKRTTPALLREHRRFICSL